MSMLVLGFSALALGTAIGIFSLAMALKTDKARWQIPMGIAFFILMGSGVAFRAG